MHKLFKKNSVLTIDFFSIRAYFISKHPLMKSILILFILFFSLVAWAATNSGFRAIEEPGTSSHKVSFRPFEDTATSYHWDFGNGVTSADKEPTATFSKPGNYIIKLMVDNGAERDSSFMSIEVR
jgi:hypothetical protein